MNTVLLQSETTSNAVNAVCHACGETVTPENEMFCCGCGCSFHDNGSCGHAPYLCDLLAETAEQ